MNAKEIIKNLEYKNLPIEDKISFQLERLRKLASLKILLDGLAGVGKGTLTEEFSEDLDLRQVKTGDMYRVITWYLLESGVPTASIQTIEEEELEEILSGLEIKFNVENSSWSINHPNVEDDIVLTVQHLRSPDVDGLVSKVSKKDVVRDVVDESLQEIVKNNDKVISEGRDMYQVFADDRSGLTMIYMYAFENDLIKRQKGRQLETTGEELSLYQAASVLRRNNDDNNKERGKLLLGNEISFGNYDLVINNSGLEIRETYLLVLESLNTLNDVRTKIEEVALEWIRVSKIIEELSEERVAEMKEFLIFISFQWDSVCRLIDIYERNGSKDVGAVLLQKLDCYQRSLMLF